MSNQSGSGNVQCKNSSEPNEDGDKHLVIKWSLFAILDLSNAAMVDLVVFEGVIFCKHQYSFASASSLHGVIFLGFFS